MSQRTKPPTAHLLFLSLLLPLCAAQTSFRFTAPPLQCSIITVQAADTDTAFLGTFFAADESAATSCVSIFGPQVMVVASGGDPGATTSSLLVPTRVGNTVNRRLLSVSEGGGGGEAERFSSLLYRSFSHLMNVPAPLLGSTPVLSRRPITGLFEEEEGGPFGENPSQETLFGFSFSGVSPDFDSQGVPLQGHFSGGGVESRAMLQDGTGDAAPHKATTYFTCPLLPSGFWNVTSGPFPDPRTLPNSVVNGSFLLSAGCQNRARSTLFLYNRCQNAIPLVFQAMQSSTEYCDLYNFQKYFSNTLFVRVIVMVGGVLACVLVVFSLGCLIGICRNRRLARARARRQLAAQEGQNLLRLRPPEFALPRGRVVEVPMYEVNLDRMKESNGDEAAVVGKDGRSFIVVIQPGMSENPSVETLAMSGAISIATEDVRHSSRSGGPSESSHVPRGQSPSESGASSQVVRGIPEAEGGEQGAGGQETAGEGTPAVIEMLPIQSEEAR